MAAHDDIQVEAGKLQPTTFIEHAFRAKCRIVNWPIEVPFFGVGVTSRGGFMAGYKVICDILAKELGDIALPRIEHVKRKVNATPEPQNAKSYFYMERWTNSECSLI